MITPTAQASHYSWALWHTQEAALDAEHIATAENERLGDMEYRLSRLLWHLTGGKLSKTGYSVETMTQAIEAEFEDSHQRDVADLRNDLNAAQATLAAVEEAIRRLNTDGSNAADYEDPERQKLVALVKFSDRVERAVLDGQPDEGSGA